MNQTEGKNTATSGKHSGIVLSEHMGNTITECNLAQKNATQSAVDFIFNELFHKANGKTEPVMLSFSYHLADTIYKLNIPLILLVPIPFMQISNSDISFYVNFTNKKHSNNSYEVRLSESTEQLKKKSNRVEGYDVRNNIRVNIRSTLSDMPGGMARLLEVINSNCASIRTIDQ